MRCTSSRPAPPARIRRHDLLHYYRSRRLPGEIDYMLALPVLRSLREHHRLLTLQADVVHSQHPVWVGAWGHRWARRRKLPFISTVHTQYEMYADRAFLPEKWVEYVVSRHVGRFFNLCDVVTTPVTDAPADDRQGRNRAD